MKGINLACAIGGLACIGAAIDLAQKSENDQWGWFLFAAIILLGSTVFKRKDFEAGEDVEDDNE